MAPSKADQSSSYVPAECHSNHCAIQDLKGQAEVTTNYGQQGGRLGGLGSENVQEV